MKVDDGAEQTFGYFPIRLFREASLSRSFGVTNTPTDFLNIMESRRLIFSCRRTVRPLLRIPLSADRSGKKERSDIPTCSVPFMPSLKAMRLVSAHLALLRVLHGWRGKQRL